MRYIVIPKNHLRLSIALFCAILSLLSLNSCRTVKEIPVQTEEKVIIRDSIIRIHDTLTVEVPIERVVEVIPQLDTSVLKTSVAESVAYLDTYRKKLCHTLEQKGTLKTKIDTCYLTQTVEKVVERDVPVEVEVIKYRRDALFWVSIGLNCLVLLIIGLKIYFRKT